MKKLILSAIVLLLALTSKAQPAGGFGGFQLPEVKLDTSQQWKDVNYAGDDQAYHTCDIYLPKQQKERYPVVIHIYGSAWFSNNSKGAADLGTIVKSLLEAGYAVVCPNHRSSMDARWPAQLHDIKAVVRFVRGEAEKYHFDPSFVATSGFSSGGHLSSTTATTSGMRQATVGSVTIDLEGNVGNYTQQSSAVSAACDWSGPIDLTAMDCDEHMTMGDNSPEDVLLGSKLDKEPDKYRSLSATTYVDKNDPPVIIFHGEKDNVVPCCQGRTFYEVLQGAGVRTEATFVPEGGHGMGMYSEENLQKMVRFLNSIAGVDDGGSVASPDGRLTLLPADRGLRFCRDNQTILDIPSIGLGTAVPSENITFTFLRPVREDYTMLIGKRHQCVNEAREYVATLSDNVVLRVRLYNDGLVFRYEVQGLENALAPEEKTAYRIPEGTRRWIQHWTDGYEDFYPLLTSSQEPDKWPYYDVRNPHNRWGFPTLLEIPGSGQPSYALITESNLERNQSAASLFSEGDLYRVVPDKNEQRLSGDWHTPWRVVIAGSLAGVVESTLPTDVADPCKLTDVSWIQPGVVSWIYWANNHGSNDYNIIKKYVDMATTLHLPYVLIDAEWDEMKDGKTIEDAVAYARSQGIRPLIWYNSSVGWINGAPGPKFRLNKPEDREKEFAWCERIGVAGVKIDFFSGDNQDNMAYCIDLLESAARHHLLVNFHGAPIPRGWQRTYPNLLSTEGVYGAEWYNNTPAFTNRAARHNATLPFTRNVIGPMDYTPCAFSDSQHPHITTDAHELALTVLFESGLQHLADRPESFLAQPAAVQQFLGKLPSTWDETRLLDGYPGEFVVMARRSGKTWYIAGINGGDEVREIQLQKDADSSFLSSVTRQLSPATVPAASAAVLSTPATLFLDASPAPGDRLVHFAISESSSLPTSIICQPRGGFVIVLSSEK